MTKSELLNSSACILSTSEVDSVLAPIGLKIGSWNEIADISTECRPDVYRAKVPKSAMELYVAVLWFSSWLSTKRWVLVQFDNSTSPSEDEVALFEQLVGFGSLSWDISTHRSIVLKSETRTERLRNDALISGLMFFALLFQWHIGIVSDSCKVGQRISLQDGDVYFFGDGLSVSRAKGIVETLREHPHSSPPTSQQQEQGNNGEVNKGGRA